MQPAKSARASRAVRAFRASRVLAVAASLIAQGSCFATFDDALLDPGLFAQEYKSVDMREASVVELSRTEHIDYIGGGLGRVEKKVQRVFRVLGERGVDLADFRIKASKGTKVSFRARTILETGETHETTDANTFEDEETIDGETIHFFATRIPGVSSNCIVEMDYTLSSEGLPYVITDSISSVWAPLLRYDLSIYVSKGIAFEIRTYNTPQRFTLERDGQGYRAKLHVENVNASVREEYSPPTTTFDPWWMFAVRQYGPTLEDLARWDRALRFVGSRFYEDDDDRFDKTPEVDAGACGDVKCKVERALAYVEKTTRYNGLASMFNARSLSAVISSGTANSTERAMLLYAALDELDVKAALAPTTRTMSQGIDTTFPAYDWFNHLVVVVHEADGKRVVVDPSCTFCAYGELPYWTRGAFAVELMPARKVTGDFAIDATPIDVAGKLPGGTVGRDITTLTLTLDESRALSGAVDQILSSDSAHGMARFVRRTNAKTNSKDVTRWANRFLSCGTSSDPVAASCEGATCKRRAKIACDSQVLKTKDRLILSLSLFDAYQEDTFTKAVRTRDLHVPYDEEIVDRLVLTPPKGFVVDELPPDETVQSKSFVASVSSRVGADGVVVVTRTLRYVPGVVPKSDYPNAQKVLRRYADWRQHLLAFRRATPAPPSSVGIGVGSKPEAAPSTRLVDPAEE